MTGTELVAVEEPKLPGPMFEDVVRKIDAPVLEVPKTLGEEAGDQSASLRRIANTLENLLEWRIAVDRGNAAFHDHFCDLQARIHFTLKAIAVFSGVIALACGLALWVK